MLSILLVSLALIFPSDFSAQSYKNNYSINKNGRNKIKVHNNGKDYKIEYEGEITLSNDDKDITGISDGGFIEIEKSSFGSRRRIVIESNRSGDLERRYYVGRSEKDFYPEGKAWLADILPDVVNSTTIAAESRVRRFYDNGGADAVLSQIKKMDSDYVKARYFSLLLDENLNENELVAVINLSGREINSDHYLATILKSNQRAFLSSATTIDAYINATRSLNSDHYMTNVLKQVISDRSITDDQMAKLLDMSKNISSDHYLTNVLTSIMNNRTLNAQNVSKIIDLSRDISSDHYKTQVLKKVIRERDIPKEAYTSLMATLDDVSSDHYTTEIIKDLLDKTLDENAPLQDILNLVQSNVGSDHYSAVIFKQLAKQNLSDEQLIIALNATSNVGSDHYMSVVLLAFAPQVNRSSSSVKDAFKKAAKSIGSDTYYGRVAKAID